MRYKHTLLFIKLRYIACDILVTMSSWAFWWGMQGNKQEYVGLKLRRFDLDNLVKRRKVAVEDLLFLVRAYDLKLKIETHDGEEVVNFNAREPYESENLPPESHLDDVVLQRGSNAEYRELILYRYLRRLYEAWRESGYTVKPPATVIFRRRNPRGRKAAQRDGVPYNPYNKKMYLVVKKEWLRNRPKKQGKPKVKVRRYPLSVWKKLEENQD